MPVSIEHASPKHLNRLYEIETKCFDKEAFTRNQIAQLLTDYNSVSLVARKREKIVGFVIGTIYAIAKKPAGHILTIDVVPEHRKEGVGQTLLVEIEEVFMEKGVKSINLEVREDNIAALNLYQRLGYKKAGKLHFYYGDSHGIHLKKVLG